MIDRVITYVRSVVSGEVEGNERIGKFLLDSLMETNEGVGIEVGALENLFNAHLQVTLLDLGASSCGADVLKLYRTPLWFHTWPIWSDLKLKYPLAWRLLHSPWGEYHSYSRHFQ